MDTRESLSLPFRRDVRATGKRGQVDVGVAGLEEQRIPGMIHFVPARLVATMSQDMTDGESCRRAPSARIAAGKHILEQQPV
jgi:hypothetical protein